MGVESSVTPFGCCNNSILHLSSASITPYTDFNFYGVLQQHLNSTVQLQSYKISSFEKYVKICMLTWMVFADSHILKHYCEYYMKNIA